MSVAALLPGRRVGPRATIMIMVNKPGVRITPSIPDHRELDRGLLRDLIFDAGSTLQQFAELLD